MLNSLFMMISVLLFAASVTANVSGRALGWLVPLWFIVSAIATELALPILVIEWALLLVGLLALDDGGSRVSLLLLLLSQGLTVRALWRHFDTGAIMERALSTALGSDYANTIPIKRRHHLQRHITGPDWQQPLAFTRPGVDVQRNIAYGPAGKRNTLDIYRLRTGGEHRPVLLQIHGGAWLLGHKGEQALPLLNHMAALGWVCVSINYRLSPQATFPDHIIDVKRAIAWIREHIQAYGGDPDFIAVTGGSAGGHLASLAALTPNYEPWQPGFESADTRLQAAMPLYGVYDLCDRTGIRHGTRIDDWILTRLLKVDRAAHPERYEEASPVNWLSADAPPFFMVQGTADTLVWVEEARQFMASFTAVAEKPMVYAELPGAQHAFDTIRSPRTAHFLNAAALWLEWSYAQWQGRQSA